MVHLVPLGTPVLPPMVPVGSSWAQPQRSGTRALSVPAARRHFPTQPCFGPHYRTREGPLGRGLFAKRVFILRLWLERGSGALSRAYLRSGHRGL